MAYGKPTFWKDELGMLRLGWVFAIMSGVLLLALVAVFTGVFFVSRYSCEVNGEQMHVDTHYRFWGSGCYVELQDGTSIPLDKYRGFEEVEP